MLLKFPLYITSIAVFLNIKHLLGENITISTPDGKITGRTEVTKTNVTFNAFSGLRYAQPPTGNLRFKPPIPVEPWNGIYDATYERSICYQTSNDSKRAHEDCLFLNIYSPDVSDGSLPVMVFIHGGGFVNGNAGSSSFGPGFFVESGVVLASIQYRLGPFGFSSTSDMVIPGNAGLKDQTLALKWIQQNIKYFGGDPNKVTIFGQSAGSASVSYHLLSNNSAFKKIAAILESGSALSAWAYQRDQRYYTFKTATYIDPNFNSNSSEDLLGFLLSSEAEAIHNASMQITTDSQEPGNTQIQQGFYYSPVIEPDHDDAFLTQSMFEMFQNGTFNKVPIMIGMNAEEGLMTYNSNFNLYVDAFNNNGTLLLPRNMHIDDDNPNKDLIVKAIEDFYGISKNKSYEEQEAPTIRYLTDTCFARSIIKQTQLQSKYVETYFYVFSYHGEMGNRGTEVAGTGNVTHGEELYYIFVRRMSNGQKTSEDLDQFPKSDQLTHYRMLKLWINFASTLNPTPEPDALFNNITWPVSDYMIDSLVYLDINEDLALKTNPREEAYNFWKDLYEKYAVPPLDGY